MILNKEQKTERHLTYLDYSLASSFFFKLLVVVHSSSSSLFFAQINIRSVLFFVVLRSQRFLIKIYRRRNLFLAHKEYFCVFTNDEIVNFIDSCIHTFMYRVINLVFKTTVIFLFFILMFVLFSYLFFPPFVFCLTLIIYLDECPCDFMFLSLQYINSIIK